MFFTLLFGCTFYDVLKIYFWAQESQLQHKCIGLSKLGCSEHRIIGFDGINFELKISSKLLQLIFVVS